MVGKRVHEVKGVIKTREEVPIDSIRAYPGNPRKIAPKAVKAVAASIKEFGWQWPILVDELGEIVAGHTRHLAAKHLGLETVPIERCNLPPAQMRAFRIADNRVAMESKFDDIQLGEELRALMAEDFVLTATGFSKSEIDRILGPSALAHGDADASVPLEPVTVSSVGDIFILGDHRIACGSSTDADTVSRVLAGANPHLMVTDPPYGVNYDPSWRDDLKNSSKGTALGVVMNDHTADWTDAWKLFKGSVAYVWHGGLHGATVQHSLEKCGFVLRAQIIWKKTRPAFSRGSYHWQHEPALYVVRHEQDDRFNVEHEVASYAVRKGESSQFDGGRKQNTVWEIDHNANETGHSTQKPVECMRRPIENNSQRGEAVYEPFSGSGTTIIAAEQCGRRCLAIELSPAYVDMAVRRWQKFTGRVAIHEGSGFTFDEVADGAIANGGLQKEAKSPGGDKKRTTGKRK